MMSNSRQYASGNVAPLIHVPSQPSREIAFELVSAFQRSGFLRITTPLVPLNLQIQALEAAEKYIVTQTSNAISHPIDPKLYCMLTTSDQITSVSSVLAEYALALELTKTVLLRCLAVGLNIEEDYFARLHSENNSAMRLLKYPTVSERSSNRCKEHSDYGSITLLLTDGVNGLEAYKDGKWHPVPHHEGYLVVNAGSLLQNWTNGKIPATLHRVAGPESAGSCSPRQDLLNAVTRDRISIAFFCDPNKSATSALQSAMGDKDDNDIAEMSVADYIRWRSGGDDTDIGRRGLAFTDDEEKRVRSQ